MIPRKQDGSQLVYFVDLKTGNTYCDTVPVYERDVMLHRSGPEHPLHHHVLEDYGLEGGLHRCRKCGLVALPDGV